MTSPTIPAELAAILAALGANPPALPIRHPPEGFIPDDLSWPPRVELTLVGGRVRVGVTDAETGAAKTTFFGTNLTAALAIAACALSRQWPPEQSCYIRPLGVSDEA